MVNGNSSITNYHLLNLHAQIRPAQFFAERHVGQCLCTDHILDLIRLDRARCGRPQHIDHVTSESLTRFDRARRTQTAALNNLPVAEYTPATVKQALTGYGNADKLQMQMMVQSLLELEEVPRPDDAADGVAVALCHLQTARYQSLVGE